MKNIAKVFALVLLAAACAHGQVVAGGGAGSGSGGTTFATPYATSGGVTVDSNFTPVTKITCSTFTNIDSPSDVSGNYACADGTGLVVSGYPLVATNGEAVYAGGYDNEAQIHFLKAVSGHTSVTMNASIISMGISNHSANVGVLVCDSVNNFMSTTAIFGNGSNNPEWVDIQWQANFTSVSPPVSPTSCVGPYPLSGYWNNFNKPTDSPPGPQFSTGVDVLQFLDPGNMYFRVVYYPTTIPNPNGGTIAGPGWAYWYSRDGKQFTILDTVCASGCGTIHAVGPFTHVGIYYYTGNRNGAAPGASILDVKSFYCDNNVPCS